MPFLPALLRPILPYSPLLILASPTSIPLHLISSAVKTDKLQLSLGCQQPLDARRLNDNEYPACGAMTTGYVFRVENEATVWFLKTIATTGALTHLKVSPQQRGRDETKDAATAVIGAAASSAAYGLSLLFLQQFMVARKPSSWPLALALLCLLISRMLYVYVLAKRTSNRHGWRGASEPGVKGSLLVLLSQDRWVRLDGEVDDLKAVTSGAWMRRETWWQGVFSQMSCLLVWVAVIVGLGIEEEGEKAALVLLGLVRHGVMARGVRGERLRRKGLIMTGRRIEIDQSKGENGVVTYRRRLDMAEELIKESGRKDWAEQMGMVKTDSGRTGKVIM